jgi:hypothetical protein
MAGLLPTFATAPRMVIKIAGQNLAMAIGFNFNLTVDVQPVYVIGELRPIALEPTMYGIVTGTLQIMKIATAAGRQARIDNSKGPDFQDTFVESTATNAKALLSSNVASSSVTTGEAALDSDNSQLSLTELLAHFTPEKILASKTFDIDVYTLDHTDASAKTALATKAGDPISKGAENLFVSIKNCRFTSRNVNIAMGSFTNTPLNFMGLLAVDSLNENSTGNAIGPDNVITEG